MPGDRLDRPDIGSDRAVDRCEDRHGLAAALRDSGGLREPRPREDSETRRAHVTEAGNVGPVTSVGIDITASRPRRRVEKRALAQRLQHIEPSALDRSCTRARAMTRVKPSIRPTETYTEPNFLRLHTCADPGTAQRLATIEHLSYSAEPGLGDSRGWRCETIVDGEAMSREDALFIASAYAKEHGIPVIYECHSEDGT